jgi:hypothetical protein
MDTDKVMYISRVNSLCFISLRFALFLFCFADEISCFASKRNKRNKPFSFTSNKN